MAGAASRGPCWAAKPRRCCCTAPFPSWCTASAPPCAGPAPAAQRSGAAIHRVRQAQTTGVFMSYRTIVVHVDHARHAEERMRQAAMLAAASNAHLVGSAFTGLSRYAASAAGLELRMLAPAEMAAFRARSESMLDRFDSIAAAAGVTSVERRLQDDEPGGGLALQARYADLVVLSQSDPDDPACAHLPGGLPEQVVLDGGRGVLILPFTSQPVPLGQRVLIAWDGSLEATHAVYHALPLLRGAGLAVISTFGADGADGGDGGDGAGSEPGADLAQYLSRHGIQCVVRQASWPLTDGADLLSLAADVQADLIVMGCYGHSRFREIMLGGVTQSILRSMTVAVLMSH